MGGQEKGFDVLSGKVCVQGGCCIVRGRVVEGVHKEGFYVLSCEVCDQGGCCIVSGKLDVGMHEEGFKGFVV